ELGHAFIASHQTFNVFRSIFGVDIVSDDVFVLVIGLAEAAIGAALVSGQLTRLVVLGLWLPFHVGIPVLPNQELIGHLPIFGIMYMLLVHDAKTSMVPASQPSPARPVTTRALASWPSVPLVAHRPRSMRSVYRPGAPAARARFGLFMPAKSR